MKMDASDLRVRFIEKEEKLLDRYRKAGNLDSHVFIEIPERKITDVFAYRDRLLDGIETKWMADFNGNEDYYPYYSRFEDEDEIGGVFGDVYFSRCKLHRYWRNMKSWGEDGFRMKRGLLLSDDYSYRNVGKVHLIADNLTEFLEQEGIEYNRVDFEKGI